MQSFFCLGVLLFFFFFGKTLKEQATVRQYDKDGEPDSDGDDLKKGDGETNDS